MATQNDVARLGPKSIADIEQYLIKILETHKMYQAFRNKAEQIDIAYYRYRVEEDKKSGTMRAGVDLDNIEAPLVISQVDSYVGYLAEVFLSGYPMFPVVSSPRDRKDAELLESIIDTHSTLGGYARQFLMGFRDGVKYNLFAMEHAWDSIDQYSVMSSYLKPGDAARLAQVEPKITKLKRLNPYNLVFDHRVENPADVAFDGEFAGYVELSPRIPLKRFINRHSRSGLLYNVGDALNSKWGGFTTVSGGGNYYPYPEVNDLVFMQAKDGGRNFNWLDYLAGSPSMIRKNVTYSSVYEKCVMYCRIIPNEFGISAPRPNHPQIWKFVLINGKHLLYACKVYSAFDLLPITIGQPLEDGFAIQTQSIAENQLPMQAIASSLFNIRLASARRAVSDRAIYDPMLINESDINAPVPAPKIPARMSGLNEKTLSDAYYQIPFNESGTQAILGDLRTTMEFSDLLSGQNKPSRGQFQKGNKSVREWEDTMSGMDDRRRMPAITIEYQVMMPIKENIKLNIFQHQPQGIFQASRTGEMYEVTAQKLEELRNKVLGFRLSDGYTPKSKMASTDFLATMMQSVAQSEILAQTWGAGLPAMFAHLGQLGGVRDLEQYLPQQTGQPGQGGTPPGGSSGTPA